MERNNWDLFCQVVDNYGDIGVAYRLAKELKRLGCKIRLFVDDLNTFKKIEPYINEKTSQQEINEIEIHKWTSDFDNTLIPNDVVVELFACHLPDTYIDKISDINLWINLEYLSAEQWIESCHKQISFEKNKKKYFFFPGFTNKTGGINFEKRLIESNYKKSEIIEQTIKEIGNKDNFLFISVFTYESYSLLDLINGYSHSENKRIVFIIPEGKFSKYLFSQNIELKKSNDLYISKSGNIIKIIPMMNQEEYDKLLKSCDFNFVRGEDSFIRAQLAGKPFIWHIYPQKEDYHIVKLKAFLELYTKEFNEQDKEIYCNLMLDFNENSFNNLQTNFSQVLSRKLTMESYAHSWLKRMISNKSLANNLLTFAQSH